MKRFKVCALTTLLILAGLAIVNPAQAVECRLMPIEPANTCDGTCHVVLWGYSCNCGTPTFTIERSCCTENWVTIATGVTGGSYRDCMQPCKSARYRITMVCPPGCGATGPLTYTTAECITCP